MSRRRRGDLPLVIAAAFLLLVPAIAWVLLSVSARTRRDVILASVPAFPARGQGELDAGIPARALVVSRAAAPRAPPPRPAPRPSHPLAPFLSSRTEDVAAVQINALLNTPLFDHLKECLPEDFEDMERKTRAVGFELERDVDRIAFVPGGTVASGFFEGKPVAELMARAVHADSGHEYRGTTIFRTTYDCRAQLGNLLFYGWSANGCEALVDRALDTRPDEDAVEDAYGDVFYRMGNTTLSRVLSEMHGSDDEMFRNLLSSLSGLTVRANVWDAVALSLEAQPSSGVRAYDLSRMARAAIRLARTQIANDDVELQALADLANVVDRKDQLEVQLAVPAKDLFEKLHFPCPGRSRDGGTP